MATPTSVFNKIDPSANYTGLQVENTFNGNVPIGNATHIPIDLGFDYTTASKLKFTFQWEGNWAVEGIVDVERLLSTNKSFIEYWKDEYWWIIQGANNNTIEIKGNGPTNSIGSFRLYKVEAIANAANGFVVPTATTLAIQRTISLTGGLGTISGNATAKALEGIPTVLKLNLNPGQSIASVAIDVGTIELNDPISGTVVVIAGNTDSIITITEQTAATFSSIQTIDKFTPAVVPTNINNTTVNTGWDLTNPAIEILEFSLSDNPNANRWPIAQIELRPTRVNGDTYYIWNHEASYMILTINDYSTGAIGIVASGRGVDLHWIKSKADAANGFVVPAATTLAAKVDLSINAGGNTISGLTAFPVYEQVPGYKVHIDLPAGQMIDTLTTSPFATVADPIEGTLNIQIPQGTGNVDLTVTFKALSSVIQSGITNVSGAGSSVTSIVFPTPFASAPNVQVTLIWEHNVSTNPSLTTRAVALSGEPTATGFDVMGIDNVNVLDKISWTAIG